MKKLSVLMIAVLAVISLNAQNRLIVFSDEGEKFVMFLNGEQQNQDPAVNVKSADLNSDSYRVKIAFNNKSIPELNKNVYFPEPNKEFTFSVAKNKKGEYTLKFVSEAPFTAQSKPATPSGNVTEVAYETPQKTETPPAQPTQTQTVNQTITTDINTQTTGTSGNTETIGLNMTVGENGMNVSVTDPDGQNVQFNMNVNVGDPNMTGTSTTVTTTTTTTSTYNESVTISDTDTQIDNYGRRPGGHGERPNDGGNNNQQPTVNGPCAYPMGSSDFTSACNSIKAKSFEDSKITLAKQVVKANCMSTDQIFAVMELFDFESSKLDFAKYAYDYVYDKNNYYKVNDAFDFESSIDELNSYIESK